MALSILDGTQTATTLSTILSSGQHITAHTVVSLGTQAITDMRGAVSGSVVSVSSLPAISGTVTANLAQGLIDETGDVGSGYPRLVAGIYDVQGHQFGEGRPFPISGTVTVGAGTAQIGSVTASISGTVPISISSVTIGNTVTIAGTVTANPTGTQTIAGTVSMASQVYGETTQAYAIRSAVAFTDGGDLVEVTDTNPLPISGTVAANTFALQGTAVTTSNFTSTTASTVLANYNATREVLTIFNEGAGNLHICAGATCTTIAYQVRLSSGDYYEVPNHQTTITHSAVFATAGTARVTQVS